MTPTVDIDLLDVCPWSSVGELPGPTAVLVDPGTSDNSPQQLPMVLDPLVPAAVLVGSGTSDHSQQQLHMVLDPPLPAAVLVGSGTADPSPQQQPPVPATVDPGNSMQDKPGSSVELSAKDLVKNRRRMLPRY